jgi:hypothetical protein
LAGSGGKSGQEKNRSVAQGFQDRPNISTDGDMKMERVITGLEASAKELGSGIGGKAIGVAWPGIEARSELEALAISALGAFTYSADCAEEPDGFKEHVKTVNEDLWFGDDPEDFS